MIDVLDSVCAVNEENQVTIPAPGRYKHNILKNLRVAYSGVFGGTVSVKYWRQGTEYTRSFRVQQEVTMEGLSITGDRDSAIVITAPALALNTSSIFCVYEVV